MIDNYGRTIDYMRISVTDRCNLRCRYCMPKPVESLEHDQILTYEEILSIVRAAVPNGITNFRITGGEPLVRKGICQLIAMIKDVPGVDTVSITTNGILLSENLSGLIAAGIDRINISLDTLDARRFADITGTDALEQVLKGMTDSLKAGIPTKINAVLLKSIPEDLPALAALAETAPLDVRFIELMPIGYGCDFKGITQEEARQILLQWYPDLHPVDTKRGNGPAHYESCDALMGNIGWIDAISHKFCAECNRLRVTSTGLLKPCLCFGEGVDLAGALREGIDESTLRDMIRTAILNKPKEHVFADQSRITEHHKMVQIGG